MLPAVWFGQALPDNKLQVLCEGVLCVSGYGIVCMQAVAIAGAARPVCCHALAAVRATVFWWGRGPHLTPPAAPACLKRLYIGDCAQNWEGSLSQGAWQVLVVAPCHLYPAGCWHHVLLCR